MIDIVRSCTDRQLKERAHLSMVRSLSLDGREITDEGMSLLVDCENLQELHLINTAITDQGLESIGKIKSLKWLLIDGAKVSDAGFADLTGLSQLVGLQIAKTGLTDEGLKSVAQLPRLAYLEAIDSNLHSKGLSSIAAAPSLNYLRIASPMASDDDFLSLAFSTSLHSITFDMPRVSKAAIEEAHARLPGCVLVSFASDVWKAQSLSLSLYCIELYDNGEYGLARDLACRALAELPMLPALHGARALINLQLDQLSEFRTDLENARDMALARHDDEMLGMMTRYLKLQSIDDMHAVITAERPEVLLRERIEGLLVLTGRLARRARPVLQPVTENQILEANRRAFERVRARQMANGSVIVGANARQIDRVYAEDVLLKRFRERRQGESVPESKALWYW